MVLMASCSVNRNSQSSNSTKQKSRVSGTTEAISEVKTTDADATLELIDYLRRVPGVQISGSRSDPVIRIRSGMSLLSDYEPLYVIDGNPIGNDYKSAASQVDPNDIASVSVLKDVSSTNMYGMRGANGVIVIKTKKH